MRIMPSSNTISKGISYAVNFSFFLLGIPFIVFMFTFPLLLIIMAFLSEEEQVISLTYIWVYALIGLIIYAEFIFARGMIRRFLEYNGVSSLKEYYALHYSKDARVVKKKKQIQTEERVASLFDNLEIIEAEATKRAREQEKYVLPDPSHVTFIQIQQTTGSKKEVIVNVMVFLRGAGVVLIPMLVINGLIMYLFSIPIIDFMWAFIFFEGMLLSFVGTGAGIHKPKKADAEERTGLLVFLVGKRGMEMDKKMFILSLGAFTVLIGMILLTTVGKLPG
jgi:hypothetical protein